MASSSGGSGSGIHRSDHWESTVEGRSSAKASSSSGPEPLSSSIDTEQDASIDTAASQDHSASTRRLWSAVKVSAKLAGAHRRAKEDDLSAFDAEGMSDSAGNRSSGAYLEQWNSIAHFLDEDEDEMRNRDQQKGPSRRRERVDRSRMGEDDMNHASLTEEPESMLSSNLDEIPRQEDPLSYASGTMLLDTESESSGDEAYDTCTETGDGKASQSRLGSRVKNIIRKRPSPFAKTVFKCVLAYFVASLFTYSPNLSHRMALMLPNHDHSDKVPISNLHLIATVSVYFHPGRSMGSMVEASIYAMAGFLYSIFLGVASMLLAVFLHDQDLPLTSNFLTVVVFVGIGMALVGYAKVKIGRPNFNTACSLIGVITFTVIVSEGSTHLGRFSAEKIWQVTLVVFVGTLISNIICFAIWPTSACTSLQADIQRNLESFSTLLKVLTKTFLLDDMKEFNIRSHRIKEAIDDHHASFISLKKNLAEAKLEVPFDVRIRGRVSSYVRVVDSLNVLAQHLGGLRSSCGLQHEMIITQRARHKKVSGDKDFAVPHMSTTGSDDNSSHNGADLDGQSAAFRQFLNNVGPHMRSLVFTCSRTLKSITTAFAVANNDQKGGEPVASYDSLASDVSAALKRFQHEQTVAIKRLYTMEPAYGLRIPGNDAKKTASKSDEDINLIFYFVFLLEEFSKELNILVKACDTIQQEEQMIQESRKRAWWKQLIFPFSISRARNARQSRYKRSSQSTSFAKAVRGLFVASTPSINLPSTRAHQENTKQTPLALTTRDRVYRHIWRLGQFLKEPDTKFAIKAGLGAALLASPAFIMSTRHWFTAYKGQWALVSYMVVLSPTVGQSNQMSIHRSLGTLLGAGAAMSAYYLFPDDNVALPIFGALFSIPCFCWIIGKPQLASSGRFVLLTFNLTALYSYNIRKVGVEVDEIAFHRTVAVIVGVAWATILNHLVWPFEARRELARGLSDLLFKLGFLYQQVALSYSSADELQDIRKDKPDQISLEEQPLLPPPNPRKEEERLLELSLQVHLIKLEGLLNLTKHEPRLKGPFPVDTYKQFLGCCQNILDLLHTMNQVTSRPDWHTQVRRDFIIPIDQAGKRREMVGNVGLFFWILASAFHLKTPLPPFLPPAEASRLQVLHAIRELPVVKKRTVHGSSEYLLYFAYALSMKDLIHQLETIGKLAQSSFGVLGGDVESFEEQFRVNPQSMMHSDRSSSSNNSAI